MLAARRLYSTSGDGGGRLRSGLADEAAIQEDQLGHLRHLAQLQPPSGTTPLSSTMPLRSRASPTSGGLVVAVAGQMDDAVRLREQAAEHLERRRPVERNVGVELAWRSRVGHDSRLPPGAVELLERRRDQRIADDVGRPRGRRANVRPEACASAAAAPCRTRVQSGWSPPSVISSHGYVDVSPSTTNTTRDSWPSPSFRSFGTISSNSARAASGLELRIVDGRMRIRRSISSG